MPYTLPGARYLPGLHNRSFARCVFLCMTPYGELGSSAQMAAVRRALSDLLLRHRIEGRPALVKNAYNVTFALERPEGRVAIRVNTGSNRTFEEVKGEIAWTEHLHVQGQVCAPAPVGLFAGSPLETVRVDGIDRDVPVVAYTWLPGRHVGKNRPSRHAFLLGRLMRRLHETTRDWTLPPGTSRPLLRNVVDELPWKLGDDPVFREALERGNAVVRRLESTPRRLCHFDLHFGNVKVWRGEMSVFDFDDCLIAWPGMDAAQAMFYLRREGPNDRLEQAFWEGAETSPEGLGLSRDEYEMLIGGRGLLLANDLAGTHSAALAAIAPKYIELIKCRLENLLRTGVYDASLGRPS